MTLSLTFSQSFVEQNVSVQLKLLRFSAIFRNKARNAGRSDKNAGMREITKMREFPHDCGTVDTYVISCWAVAALRVAEESNAGVTCFAAEITVTLY